jgi:hypothetical protein
MTGIGTGVVVLDNLSRNPATFFFRSAPFRSLHMRIPAYFVSILCTELAAIER